VTGKGVETDGQVMDFASSLEQVSNLSFFHLEWGRGGFLLFAGMADDFTIAHALRMLFSKDGRMSELAWSSLRQTTMSKKFD
jgi:hypothetical protein